MRVPVDLIPHYGTKTINRSTRTDSLTEAERQLTALQYEFNLLKGQLSSNNDKDTYRQHLAYLKAIIDEAKEDGNETVIDSADFDITEKTPEPIVKAINDARTYYYDGSLKNAKHNKDTYGITLKEALELEEQRIDRLPKDTGLKKKRNTAVTMFLQHIGKKDIKLSDIGRRDAHLFVDAMQDAGKSHKTIRNYLAGLQACWEAASRYEHVEAYQNPFKDISVATTKSDSYKPLEQQHIKALLQETASTQHPFHYVFRVGLVTGARLNEITSLTKDDIIEVDGVICMDIKDGKTATSERIVPLRGGMDDKLIKLAAKTDVYLFPYFQNRSADFASQAFQKVRDKAGVSGKGYVFHSLRHSMATALERSGVAEHQMNRILGHKTTNVSTGTYSRGLKIPEVAKQIDEALKQPEYSNLFITNLS